MNCEIARDITARIQSKKLRLPSPPDIYLRLAGSVDADFNCIVSILKYDASITARLLQVANSPALRGSSKAGTLGEALMKLGTRASLNLILGLSLRDRFSIRNKQLCEIARKVWEQSVYVGVSSSLLVADLAPEIRLSRDSALTAGLLHCIGHLPVIDYFSENENIIDQFYTVRDALRADLGTVILTDWGLPADIVKCAGIHPPRTYADPDVKVSYADIVALVASSRDTERSVFLESYESKVGLDVQGVRHLLDEYSTEIAALLSTLGIS